MNAREMLHLAHQRGARIELHDGGPKLIAPKSFSAYLKAEMRQRRAELIDLMRDIQEREAACQNPRTPHHMHTGWDMCDPATCDCYRMYGKPYLCPGAPCFWVFPGENYRTREKAK